MSSFCFVLFFYILSCIHYHLLFLLYFFFNSSAVLLSKSFIGDSWLLLLDFYDAMPMVSPFSSDMYPFACVIIRASNSWFMVSVSSLAVYRLALLLIDKFLFNLMTDLLHRCESAGVLSKWTMSSKQLFSSSVLLIWIVISWSSSVSFCLDHHFLVILWVLFYLIVPWKPPSATRLMFDYNHKNNSLITRVQ